MKADNQDLQDEVKNLKQELALAKAMALVGSYSEPTGSERPTGRTVKVEVCINPTERNPKKLEFKTVEYPTYYYTINIPAGAGLDLSTNGAPYYHGETYEFDPMQLADMKSRVARCWDHERTIHSENENAYRKPTHVHLVGRRAA